MMKKSLFLLMAVMPILISCSNKPVDEKKSTETVKEVKKLDLSKSTVVTEETKVEKPRVNEPIPQDVQQFIVLYKELLNFKNTNEFKQKGFGNGSKYQKWLTKANRLSETADISHFIEYNFLPGDLVALADVYVSSRGQENAASKALRAIIDDGISTINH